MKWYDVEENIIKYDLPFNITFGGRGIGKTYSTLLYLIKNRIKFIYLRNQQNEIDICCSDECNPFKAVNADTGNSYFFEKISKDICGIYDNEGMPVGYAIALNTFAKLRGVDFSDIDFIFFEEFNTSLRVNKKQGDLFFNLYETVNRNRELKGKPPVKVVMMGNALTIANPIMDAFKLIPVAEKMMADGVESLQLPERGILLEIVTRTAKEVLEAKKQTALYRAIKDTEYYNHAVNNEFINDSFYNVRERNVNEYKPLCMLHDIVLMEHKYDYGYYCTYKKSGKIKDIYDSNTLSKFLIAYGVKLRIAYLDRKIIFENYEIKTHMLDILSIK